jgi:hypothetical protein
LRWCGGSLIAAGSTEACEPPSNTLGNTELRRRIAAASAADGDSDGDSDGDAGGCAEDPDAPLLPALLVRRLALPTDASCGADNSDGTDVSDCECARLEAAGDAVAAAEPPATAATGDATGMSPTSRGFTHVVSPVAALK